ncbi:MAG: DUF2169 domain-containing protein [Nannocystaceae bacterium]
MPHADVDNRTPFVAEPLFLVDERARPLITLVIKATFDLPSRGQPLLSADQDPLHTTGEPWDAGAGPDAPSYRYEPEVAPFKLATDVVFIGHAHAPTGSTTEMVVRVAVGPLGKTLRVFGGRLWYPCGR